MKTVITLFLHLSALAQSSDYVYIPNANFKSLLVSNAGINTNRDSEISCEEAVNYSGVINAYYKSISNLIV